MAGKNHREDQGYNSPSFENAPTAYAKVRININIVSPSDLAAPGA